MWLGDDPALKNNARKAIADGNNLVFLSAAVIWEIHIKASLDKLIIPSNFQAVLERQNFEPLPITLEHAHAIAQLPPYHRDPFDRMLIAQSMMEGFTLLTYDDEIHKYNIPILGPS